ncbi:MAG: HlyD family secretion protein [Planctomycetota bacterium]|jgi:multidrug efflux pump subunit AcrA (membrane-fusion protein)
MIRIGSKSYSFRRLYLRFLPILVWLGTLACVVALFQRRAERFEILGFAQGQVRHVQATSPGRLKSVPVQLFEKVSLGDTVAVIDTVLDNESLLQDQLKAQLDTVRAGIEHLMAQLIPTQETMLAEAANLETDNVAAQRQYAVDIENARVRILETKALIASDRIMLDDLAVEVKIVQELLAEEAVARYELDKTQVAYDTLAKKIEENERLLEQSEQDFQQAQERRDEFALRQTQHPSVDSALEVIHKAITVQERFMDELWVQLEALELRRTVELKAPFDGVVVPIQGRTREFALRRPGESVLRRPGEVVVAGEPILAIAEARPREIITYASQEQIGEVRKEVEVTLIKKAYPPAKGKIALSRIVHVGPTLERKPERLWQNPAIPEWGLPILIEIPRGWELVSGELVGIRIGRL